MLLFQFCGECFQNIFEFHRFWLSIDEKQKTLKNTSVMRPEIDMGAVQPNIYANGLEFVAAEMKDDEISMDRDLILTPLNPAIDEFSSEDEKELKATNKRKCTKRTVKKPNQINQRGLQTSLSPKILRKRNERNDNEDTHSKIKEKLEKKRYKSFNSGIGRIYSRKHSTKLLLMFGTS
ncbi:uncharacterized protein LOC129237326 [Anastrepha obliqua]|uniref:uncharacterized protein LOC129237326 n=1 Tax=Anastrepha obliqua TaxID=95512 RepID=UPI002409FFB9|nr:uncharacterized protein LOC129237326 [Anastrepha obliqua]